MVVGDWMTRDPETADPETTIAATVAAMIRRRVRRLPVVERGRLVGIVSRSDVQKIAPPDLNPFSPRAADSSAFAGRVGGIMSVDPVTTTPGALIEDAAHLLLERKLRALPVVASGRLTGIITESDIFRALVATLGGGRQRGMRVTFDVAQDEDAVGFSWELSRKHGMRAASVVTYERDGSRAAVVQFEGREPPGILEELWDTGHRVISVVRSRT